MEAKTTEDLVQGAGIMVNVAFTSYPDGTVVAECTDIPGCISQGESMIEAKANIADAIAACLSVAPLLISFLLGAEAAYSVRGLERAQPRTESPTGGPVMKDHEAPCRQ